MRSRNQLLPITTITIPKMVSQADSLMSPQMHKIVPKPEMVLIMLIMG